MVNMPLFQTASNPSPVVAEALISTAPGLFNNIFEGDIVFIGFEENRIENPIILGKLYRGSEYESQTTGGAGIFDSLRVINSAIIPSSTFYNFPQEISASYENFKTPKQVADYIKWFESEVRSRLGGLGYFDPSKVPGASYYNDICIDDGDLSDQSRHYN
jgi:hypothetical protein